MDSQASTRSPRPVPRVHFERRGTGEPLVLLHGIGHHCDAWEPVMDRLAGSHDVIALDLPGFGRSDLPADDRPITMAAAVAWITDFFAELGLRRPHVAGNSLGGGLALELAAAGAVATATALAPAGFFTEWERRWALGIVRFHRASARLPEQVVRWAMQTPHVRALYYSVAVARPSEISAERGLADAFALRRCTGFEPVAEAARGYQFSANPSVPVTVAWGTRDYILPPWQAQRAEQRLPTARHVRLPGCGHVPMSDDPDLVASLILQTTRRANRPRPPRQRGSRTRGTRQARNPSIG